MPTIGTPGSFLRDDEMLAWQATVDGTLPAWATINRTNVTTPVRVQLGQGRQIRLEGMPEYIQVRRWSLRFHAGIDVQVWDIVSVIQTTPPVGFSGNYLVAVLDAPASYSVTTDVECLKLGDIPGQPGADSASFPVTAQILREPPPLGIGEVASFQPGINLTVYPLLGDVLIPQSRTFVSDSLGIGLEQPAKVIAGWPAGASGRLPIKPRDILVLSPGRPDEERYIIEGLVSHKNQLIELYVENSIL